MLLTLNKTYSWFYYQTLYICKSSHLHKMHNIIRLQQQKVSTMGNSFLMVIWVMHFLIFGSSWSIVCFQSDNILQPYIINKHVLLTSSWQFFIFFGIDKPFLSFSYYQYYQLLMLGKQVLTWHCLLLLRISKRIKIQLIPYTQLPSVSVCNENRGGLSDNSALSWNDDGSHKNTFLKNTHFRKLQQTRRNMIWTTHCAFS